MGIEAKRFWPNHYLTIDLNGIWQANQRTRRKKHKNDEWESNQTAFQRLEMSEIRKC